MAPKRHIIGILANVVTQPHAIQVTRLYGVNTLITQAIIPITLAIIQVLVIPNFPARGPVRAKPRKVGISPTAPRRATILSFPRIYFA